MKTKITILSSYITIAPWEIQKYFPDGGAMVLQLDIFNKPVYRKEDCVTDISYLVPKMKQRKVN